MVVVQGGNFGIKSTVRASRKVGKYFVNTHIHQFSEIVLVRDGSVEVTVDGKSYIAKKNDIIVISPFQVHDMVAHDFCDINMVLFSNDIAQDFISGENSYIYGDVPLFAPSQELLEFIKDKLPNTREVAVKYSLENSKLFKKLKVAICAIFEEYQEKIATAEYSKKNNMLPEVLIYMKAHYTENISQTDVAKAIGYSSCYISHCLKDINNLNFRSILNSFRVEHAKELLYKQKEKKIIDIALECGFSCERSFHRAFYSMIGMTPGEYRDHGWTSDYITSP